MNPKFGVTFKILSEQLWYNFHINQTDKVKTKFLSFSLTTYLQNFHLRPGIKDKGGVPWGYNHKAISSLKVISRLSCLKEIICCLVYEAH